MRLVVRLALLNPDDLKLLGERLQQAPADDSASADDADQPDQIDQVWLLNETRGRQVLEALQNHPRTLVAHAANLLVHEGRQAQVAFPGEDAAIGTQLGTLDASIKVIRHPLEAPTELLLDVDARFGEAPAGDPAADPGRRVRRRITVQNGGTAIIVDRSPAAANSDAVPHRRVLLVTPTLQARLPQATNTSDSTARRQTTVPHYLVHPPAQRQPAEAVLRWATPADPEVAAEGRRIQHLVEASANLRAAGATELADNVQKQADELARKIEQRLARQSELKTAASRDTLPHALNELRSEVQALRRDVDRLIRLLEDEREGARESKTEGSASATSFDGSPSLQAALERSRDKLVLVYFQAGWCTPCQKLTPILEKIAKEHEGRLELVTVDIDRAQRHTLRDMKVQSIPSVSLARGGKIVDRFVGPVSEQDLLRRIAPLLSAADTVQRSAGVESALDAFSRAAQPVPGLPPAAARDATESALERKVTLKFKDTPLSEAVAEIAKANNLNIVLDSLGLEEEAVKADTPVSLDVKDARLRSILNLMLEPLNLGYRVEDDVVKITSRMRQYGPPVVMIHAAGDVTDPEAQGKGFTLQRLGEMLISVVEPDSWAEHGGPGTLQTDSRTRSLVIRQNEHVHQKIADLLRGLR
ncbi:MAG: conjugal transfer protein TraF, partial [Planctomycetes bacterium]|nr:conjugal transfer protein TraF [Planctomycetota bacterium]